MPAARPGRSVTEVLAQTHRMHTGDDVLACYGWIVLHTGVVTENLIGADEQRLVDRLHCVAEIVKQHA